jgi:APA family basic amino acid/polyamine antiporter
VAALRRELGTFSATSIVVGGIIGSGIFFGPQEIAALQPYGLTILLVWLVAGLISLLGALSVAELGAMLPRSGGFYVYLREAYGPLPAFLTGWATLIVSDGLAAVVVVFGTFANFAAPVPGGAPAWAVLLVAALTVPNLLGIKRGAGVQNASTILKVTALGALVLVGLLAGARARGLDPLLPPGGLGPGLAGVFTIALLPALFAYDGWFYAARVAEEVRDPGRALPRALLLGTALVTVVYMAVNLVYVGVLGPQGLAQVAQGQGAAVAGQESPALAVASSVLGPAAVTLVVAGVLVSTAGASNTSMLTAPRIFFAMARDGVFFARFARIHPRWGTPHVAILFHAAVTMLLAATGTFVQLILISTVATFLFSALAVGAVIKLRRERPDAPRPYKVPGYPWVPLAFIALALVFLAAAAVAQPLFTGAFLLLLAAGVPLCWAFQRRAPRREVVLADRA